MLDDVDLRRSIKATPPASIISAEFKTEAVPRRKFIRSMARHARDFSLLAEGPCSFCGKTRSETDTFVGSAAADGRICDECLGLCCRVLAEQAGLSESTPESSAAEFPEVLLVEIMATLATKPPGAMPPPQFRCSFCDTSRPDVQALVSGPRVLICNACIADGVAIVKRA
jgi:hypothetical protein